MRRPGFLTALLASLALSACGSSTTVVSETASPTASSSGAGASAPGTVSGSASSATSTSTSPAPARSPTQTGGSTLCRAADLRGSFLGSQGAAGHGELGFALRNASARACHSFGFPGVQFLKANGASLITRSTRTTHDLFGSVPLAAIELAPGASGSFRLGVTHGLASSAGCANADALAVIAPDVTATLRISIPGGAYECVATTISPLRPGTSAFP